MPSRAGFFVLFVLIVLFISFTPPVPAAQAALSSPLFAPRGDLLQFTSGGQRSASSPPRFTSWAPAASSVSILPAPQASRPSLQRRLYVIGSSDVYTAGAAWGSPTRRPYSGGSDVFVAKLDGSGAFQWNTFLGGSGNDHSTAISVDASGNLMHRP